MARLVLAFVWFEFYKECNIMLLLEQNKQDIINLYKSGMSTNKIAKRYNCNSGTLWHHMKEWGIKLKKRQSFEGHIEDYRDKIIALYQAGKSAYAISKELKISKPTILKFLRDNNLSVQPCKVDYNNLLKDHKNEVIQLHNSGKSENEIGEELGFSGSSIHRLIDELGLEKRDWKYSVNEHFFDAVNSEEVAYVLGWFYSDGCVDNKGKMRIQIQTEDVAILHTIKDLMGYDGPLHDVPPPKKYPHRKHQTALIISRKTLADQLIKLGCVPNKSLTLTFPPSSIISDKLMPHFIRGVFDRDGSISIKNEKYLNISITSSETFLQPFREWLINHLAVDTKHYYRYSHTNTMQMMITRTLHAKIFLDWMYRDATYYLTRKFQKYEEYTKKSV